MQSDCGVWKTKKRAIPVDSEVQLCVRAQTPEAWEQAAYAGAFRGDTDVT